jgi:hypothetical protein
MAPTSSRGAWRRMFLSLAVMMGPLGAAACGSGEIELPPPRPIIVTSGERLRADPVRMDSIYAWLTLENQNIEEDPSFLIEGVPAARESMPWQTLTIAEHAGPQMDTARFQYDRAHPDITTAFNVYAHLHLMKARNELTAWLPEHASAEGFDLERAIVGRMADAWLLGRAVFDAPAYAPLDALIYAKEAGYLDAYLLTARAQEFADARRQWESEKPAELEAYRTWFRRAFNREPPGLEATGAG